MAKIPLTTESQFIVGEEKALSTVMTVLFFGLFLYGAVDAVLNKFTNLNYLNGLFVVALVPAFLFLRKARSSRIYIRINKTGIYQDDRLVTKWEKFINAYLTQKEVVLSIQDNFMLVVEHWKEDPKKGFRRNIPLTNTQNRSEEEILEAIRFFWKLYKSSERIR